MKTSIQIAQLSAERAKFYDNDNDNMTMTPKKPVHDNGTKITEQNA